MTCRLMRPGRAHLSGVTVERVYPRIAIFNWPRRVNNRHDCQRGDCMIEQVILSVMIAVALASGFVSVIYLLDVMPTVQRWLDLLRSKA